MASQSVESVPQEQAFPLEFLHALEKMSDSSQGARRIWEQWLGGRQESGVAHPGKHQVIDLFSGCGGLSLGFSSAGFEVLRGFDSWEPAVQTYNANFDHSSEMLDLSDFDLTIDRLKQFKVSDSFPAIIGGPPCQDFSTAGKRVENENADLTRLFAEYICELRPPFFVMENVPNAKNFRVYKSALSQMREQGYHIFTRTFDASMIGAPQKRKRLFAIGALKEDISDRIQQEIFQTEAFLGDSFRDEPMTVGRWFGVGNIPKFYYRHPWSYDRRGIFRSSEPSPTIRGVNRPKPPSYEWHEKELRLEGFEEVLADPSAVRALTSDERKQIQTFPANFELSGPRTVQEQMIGNAVPVMLAYFVADKVLRALNAVS